MAESFLQRLTELVHANIGNPLFGPKELASLMGMSHTSLLRKVRNLTGKPVNQLITEIRLTKAREMLQTEDLAISEIASRTGFGSPSHFANRFHKHFGYPPGEVRKKGQGAKSERSGDPVPEVGRGQGVGYN